jgi:hypothetical protein
LSKLFFRLHFDPRAGRPRQRLEALKLAGLGDEQCKGIGEMVLEWGALHAAKHVKIALNKIKDGLP